MTDDPHGFPLARPFRTSDVTPDGVSVQVVTTAEERVAIARFLRILEVRTLSADLLVRPWRGNGFAVSGTITADVVQACVLSLEPVPESVEEPVDMRFLPADAMPGPAFDLEVEIDPEAEDLPDPLTGDTLDLGAVVVEHLALGLDPYPRAAGAVFDTAGDEITPDDDRPSPFAALGKLKGRDPEAD